MKLPIYCVAAFVSLAAFPALAHDQQNSDREDRGTIEIRSQPIPEHHAFRDYLSDLKESTRIGKLDPENPVRQLETRKDRKYEPLNPFVFRW